MERPERNRTARNLGLRRLASQLLRKRAAYFILALSLLATLGAASVAQPHTVWVVMVVGVVTSIALFAIARAGQGKRAANGIELERTRRTLAQHTERLRILHEIDRGMAERKPPEEIAGAVVRPLRELLQVPRAIVNLFDMKRNEVEWLAGAGRHRVHVGPGVRYPMRLMGDADALKRGEPQIIDTRALPPSPETEALLASGVHVYMAVPMIAGGELIGALSFGGEREAFPEEQVNIAKEVATQFAIAITQARLYDRVRQHADELETKVDERTRELGAAHAELQGRNTDLLQLTAQLQAANKELEAFSYSVSHDLRAPLRAIDGFSQLLIEDYRAKLDEAGRDYLERVRVGTRRMQGLIDDMLKLSQVTRTEVHRQRINLSEIARAVVSDLRSNEPARTVGCEIQDGLFAEADSRLVRVLLDNLLGNAWKFTSKCSEPHISFGVDDIDGNATYFVRDNGAGFDMAYVEKLFRPFQRLHSAQEFTGTGIGLATVYRIVARHGGRVWAEGSVNGGAKIFFTLSAT